MSPFRHIVIVGGGTAGWMTAAALANAFRGSLAKITLIESDEIGTIGVGEATIPSILQFNRMLGIDEADFMRRTQATFKLGIQFEDWGRDGNRYFHPFGTYGASLNGVAFHQHFNRAAKRGEFTSIDAFALCAVAAKSGRFQHPSTDPRSVGSTYAYAYHLDAGLYAQFLRDYAEKRSVVRREGRVQKAVVGEDGQVEAVFMEAGDRMEGDFFIDCSGFGSLILGQALHVPYEDWSALLPCDRAIAVQTAAPADPVWPYTRAIAHSAGWQWRIPLQHRCGNGIVYCSAFMDDAQAEMLLRASLEGDILTVPRTIHFRTGRRQVFWKANCLAIGLAAGFLEPLESTAIHLIQTSIIRFLSLLPVDRLSPRPADMFNRLTAREYAQVRDFLMVHYLANSREGELFWDHCRRIRLSPETEERIDLWRESGRLLIGDELFKELSWVALLLGQDIVPDGHDPLAATCSGEDALRALTDMRRITADFASAMPTHDAYLADFMAERRTA